MEQGAPCPFCSAQIWGFEEINDFGEMPAEWWWASTVSKH
jgi:hypothetical protein